jgi:hypothetical protein
MRTEREGRFFGTIGEMHIDMRQHTMDGGLFNLATSSWRSTCGSRSIQWFVIREFKDVYSISGVCFHKVMLDISLPDFESMKFIMSRLRSPNPRPIFRIAQSKSIYPA